MWICKTSSTQTTGFQYGSNPETEMLFNHSKIQVCLVPLVESSIWPCLNLLAEVARFELKFIILEKKKKSRVIYYIGYQVLFVVYNPFFLPNMLCMSTRLDFGLMWPPTHNANCSNHARWRWDVLWKGFFLARLPNSLLLWKCFLTVDV